MYPNLDRLSRDFQNIATYIAPKDTGNLAFNSIIRTPTAYGFDIIYLGNVAPYAIFLEEGTSKSDKHKGFISIKTAAAFGRYSFNTYNGIKSSEVNQKLLSQLAVNTPARNELFLKSISR